MKAPRVQIVMPQQMVENTFEVRETKPQMQVVENILEPQHPLEDVFLYLDLPHTQRHTIMVHCEFF